MSKYRRCTSKVYFNVDGSLGDGVSLTMREYLECKLDANHKTHHKAHLMLKPYSHANGGGLGTVHWKRYPQ